MKNLPFIQTSVFVEDRYPFGGNQLATFWDADCNRELSSDTMQGIAREMNFSETTFLEKPTVKGCVSKVRIFTPNKELKFAGHPTLGTSFVMRQKGIVTASQNSAIVELGIGPIHIEFQPDDHVKMTQPSPTFMDTVKDLSLVTEAINLETNDVSDKYPAQIVSTGLPFLILPLKSLSAVKKANPSPQLILKSLKKLPTAQLLIFSSETIHSENDVHVRMFAPGVGVLEDPATGSAAGPLGAYLERYEILKRHTFGEPIQIEQGYEIERPSRLTVTVPHESMEEVFVAGKVRLVAEGTFYAP
ncbi:MAG: PhzF family phenazine biosynthesis protein [Candidatus Thorarchaeota archaeon]|nr:PhzF family phenazine biosynthesis protein [Candidatus Thorarchaeota archaeon]